MRVIAGSARRTQLKTLEGMDTRPTTDRIKETLFNMIAPYLYDYIFMDPPYNHELEKSVLTYLAESSLLAEEGIIIVEASKETDFDYAEDLGYNIIKEKEYKTNKHVFLEPAGRKEIC